MTLFKLPVLIYVFVNEGYIISCKVDEGEMLFCYLSSRSYSVSVWSYGFGKTQCPIGLVYCKTRPVKIFG